MATVTGTIALPVDSISDDEKTDTVAATRSDALSQTSEIVEPTDPIGSTEIAPPDDDTNSTAGVEKPHQAWTPYCQNSQIRVDCVNLYDTWHVRPLTHQDHRAPKRQCVIRRNGTLHLPAIPRTTLTSLLVLSSLFLFLNVLGSVFDHLLPYGLIVQVLIGITYGQPGARWLPLESQRVFVELGYIRLILIVFSGGVSTDIKALRQNAGISIAVAATGVLAPIALSFALLLAEGGMLGHGTALPAFAAGAALCSTSLGTTFEVLETSGFDRTRLGAVVASAALLDDVVGLVMVRISTSLGASGGNIKRFVILRPVLVSAGFSVVVPLVCRVVCWSWTEDGAELFGARKAAFIAQTLLLVALIAAPNYAGASILLAAYLAGAVVSWWAGLQDAESSRRTPARRAQQNAQVSQETSVSLDSQRSGTIIYDTDYTQIVDCIVKPLFFVSSSPQVAFIFCRNIVWRGILYTILMIIGKLLCGLWLVRLPLSAGSALRRSVSCPVPKFHWVLGKVRRRSSKPEQIPESTTTDSGAVQINQSSPEQVNTQTIPPREERTASTEDSPVKPLSLYPAAVIGCTMVARGEIRFLISSMAESQGVFRHPDEDPSEASELFLVITWAIFVYTIVSPLATGIVVKSIKNLESARGGSRRTVLGVWGVE
ncbi:Sodium/hydrogen exchanger family-domain-containing protein [Xylariaceae sp. FL1272]|nr:Sodium/hydrogen exchanger family-domain-containing protein [Xylariaceae sp. FL1272]